VNSVTFVSYYDFLHARASIAIARISYGNSVHLSVLVSHSGTVQNPCEIQKSRFHHMIAQSLYSIS